jgi:hypothetical protein
VFLSDEGLKTQQKTFCKKIVSKSFTKKSPKKTKENSFTILFNHAFRRFSVGGVKKLDQNVQKKLTSPGTFLAPEERTNHVKARRFVFECPLQVCYGVVEF